MAQDQKQSNKNNGLLVLSRRIGECIIIGEDRDVVVKVIDIRHGQVRLGFEAKKHIQIDREEIYLRKQKEKNSDSQQ